MTSLRQDVWLAAPAHEVWALVGDPGAINTWAHGILACHMDGSKRTLTLARGGEVVEEILTLDDELQRVRYAVCSGLPVTEHLGTLDVITLKGHGCLVVYSTDVAPEDIAVHIAASMSGSLKRLAELFGRMPVDT